MLHPADHLQLRAFVPFLFDMDEEEELPTGYAVWELVEPRVHRASYDRFKRIMKSLESQGYIQLKKPPGTKGKTVSMARSLVSMTEAGRDWWEAVEYGRSLGVGNVEAVDSDRYVGKRILAEKPLPREVWQALMRRHKAGELDIAFMPNKSL